jgi:hypothetical protein
MTTIGDVLASRLQTDHLKSLRFKRRRHTFVRASDGWAEHYQIQGSAWNRSGLAWICYLNCGISFDGLPARSPNRGFPGTHASMRSGVFVGNARPQYEVTLENVEAVAAEIADVIARCSAYFHRRHSVLRECYEREHWDRGFLADPELTRK